MRVLLTGATGFVGSFTVPALLEAGHEVVALVRSPEKAAATLERRGVDPGRVDVRVGDRLIGGAPLGVAGPVRPAISLELRRDNDPVNPLQYLR